MGGHEDLPIQEEPFGIGSPPIAGTVMMERSRYHRPKLNVFVKPAHGAGWMPAS